MLMAVEDFSRHFPADHANRRCTELESRRSVLVRGWRTGLRLPRSGQHAAAPRGDQSEDAAGDRGVGARRLHKAGAAVQYALLLEATIRARRPLLLDGGGARRRKALAALLRHAGRGARAGRRAQASSSAASSQAVCGSHGSRVLNGGIDRHAARHQADAHERRERQHREQRAEEASFAARCGRRRSPRNRRRRSPRPTRRRQRAAPDQRIPAPAPAPRRARPARRAPPRAPSPAPSPAAPPAGRRQHQHVEADPEHRHQPRQVVRAGEAQVLRRGVQREMDLEAERQEQQRGKEQTAMRPRICFDALVLCGFAPRRLRRSAQHQAEHRGGQRQRRNHERQLRVDAAQTMPRYGAMAAASALPVSTSAESHGSDGVAA